MIYIQGLRLLENATKLQIFVINYHTHHLYLAYFTDSRKTTMEFFF